MTRKDRPAKLNVCDMTSVQKDAYDRMIVARAAWIADQDITEDSIRVNLENHLRSCILDRVRFTAAEVWYVKARTLAARIAHATGLTLEQVAGVIATMSPNVEWGLQERHTLAFCQYILAGGNVKDAPGAGYGKNRKKAAKIVLGGDPHILCSGPKVYPFMLAILGDESQVVIDVWMGRSAVNVDVDQDTAARIISPVAVKRWMVGIVRDLAATYGITPAIAQAAIWLDTKETMEASRAVWNRVEHTFSLSDYMLEGA